MGEKKLDILRKRLEAYYRAEEKILQAQSYGIGSRQVERTNLASVQQKIKELETEIALIEKHGSDSRRFIRVIPLD